MNYIVIASIKGIRYMVNVDANSNSAAEHSILDMAYCGMHEYGVDAAQAFGYEDMKTDTFVSLAFQSNTVSFEEITEIIALRNFEIESKDNAEKRIREINRQMKALEEELEVQKKILAR